MLAVQAVAETAAVLGTALVIYLSLNAVTHPVTLGIKLTHLWPWPSEGTVRVIGLGICLAARRHQPVPAGRGGPRPPGRAGPGPTGQGKGRRLESAAAFGSGGGSGPGRQFIQAYC